MKTFLTNRVFNHYFLLAIGLAFCPIAVRAQTPITCGQTIASNTVANSENDQYIYVGTAGQELSFALWGPVSCNFDAMNADIYDPAGQLVATVATPCTGGAALSMTLSNSGTYTILVHENQYRGIGNYTLSIQSETGGGCDSTPIACGQTVTNRTTFNSEMDAYSYAGTAGQELSFALWGPVSCNFDAMNADIYNPAGQLVATVATPCTGGAALSMTLSNSGTYTILVHENQYRGIGNYTLSIQSETGGGCDSTPIACGQTVTNRTTFNSEMDAYSYAGTAGQELSFALWGPVSCNFDAMNADIYNPAGQLVATVATPCTGGAALSMTLSNSGTYTILVHENQYRGIGNYTLSIQSETGGGCDSTPIACGQTGSGAISQNAETDAYLIYGCSGELVQLSTSGFSGSQFDLYDPTGNKVFSIGPGTATNITFSISGSYTLLVHSGNYAGTGGYSATLTCIIGACSHTTGTTSSPPNGGTTSGGGVVVCCIPVTVCAESAPCYNFVNWTLGTNVLSTSLCYSFVAASNSTLTANFAPTAGTKNQICNFQVVGTNAAISGQSVMGDNYQLQSRTSMTTGNWSNVAGVVLSNSPGGLIILTNFGGAVAPQKFYRLDVTP